MHALHSSVLLLMAMAGAAIQAAPVPSDVCALLGTDDIRAVQGTTLRDRKASAETVGALHYRQCFFAASEFERSVSLTVISAAAGRTADRAGRAYWERTFRPEPKAAPTSGRVPRKKDPPRQVPGAGEEAFWTGDPRTGALYVLDGDIVLRISVGGVADETERLRRSVALAKAALERLKQ